MKYVLAVLAMCLCLSVAFGCSATAKGPGRSPTNLKKYSIAADLENAWDSGTKPGSYLDYNRYLLDIDYSLPEKK
jgi:hypothetical protein